MRLLYVLAYFYLIDCDVQLCKVRLTASVKGPTLQVQPNMVSLFPFGSHGRAGPRATVRCESPLSKSLCIVPRPEERRRTHTHLGVSAEHVLACLLHPSGISVSHSIPLFPLQLVLPVRPARHRRRLQLRHFSVAHHLQRAARAARAAHGAAHGAAHWATRAPSSPAPRSARSGPCAERGPARELGRARRVAPRRRCWWGGRAAPRWRQRRARGMR